MEIKLTGKTAILTCAASGIGLATAKEFLASDVKCLVAVDVAPAPGAELAAVLSASGGRGVYCGGDVSKEATAKAFTKLALEKTGRVDVLVNNAGVQIVNPIHEQTEEEWDHILGVNVKAMFWAAREVVPVMIKKGGGVILNTGSISGLAGIVGQGAYGPSKGAVHQLTRQMAVEYGKYNIRVNALALGTIDTPLVQKSARESGDADGFLKMLFDKHPIGRIAQPEEVAGFFTYLASDRASFFSGAILSMDGGFVAQ
jgi:NAD(P)-dependent dehydrogenase (short-subunit alcohol dehydrogenase family)